MTSDDSALITAVLLGNAAEVPGAVEAAKEREEEVRLAQEREEAARRLPNEVRQSLFHIRVAVIMVTPLLVALAYLLPFNRVEAPDVGWSMLLLIGLATFLCLLDWAGGRLVIALGRRGGRDEPRDPVGRIAGLFLAGWVILAGLLIWRADGFPTHESWPLILGLGVAALLVVYGYACYRVASDLRGTWVCLALALLAVIVGTTWANHMVMDLKGVWNSRSAVLVSAARKSLETKKCHPLGLPGSPEARVSLFGQARCRMGKMTVTVTGANSFENLKSQRDQRFYSGGWRSVRKFDSCGPKGPTSVHSNWVFRFKRNLKYIGQLFCGRGLGGNEMYVEVGRVALLGRGRHQLHFEQRPNIAVDVSSSRAKVGRMTKLLPKIKRIERRLGRRWNQQ